MIAVQSLLQNPWIARLGETMLHFLWQGSLIAGALSAWRGFSASRVGARARYGVACCALAAMAITPAVTFVALSSQVGAASLASAGRVAQLVSTASASAADPHAAGMWERVLPWLGAAWVVGVVFCLLRLAGGWLSTSRLRSAQARPAPSEWQSHLGRLMSRLEVKRPVRLLVSALVETPAVLGWLRPVILVPVGALAGLPADHVEALLAHELAHIRRHDYLVNLLQSLAEALLFYHPAVWWVSRIIRAEREYCCDDLAVAALGDDVLTYAQALAELESWRPAHRTAMAATGGSLRNRIRRLIDPASSSTHQLPSGTAVGVLAALMLIFVAALSERALASPAPPQEPVVELQSVWPDTVKFGDLVLEVRGLGKLNSETDAEIQVAQHLAAQVAAGQTAVVGFRGHQETVAAMVRGKRPGVTTKGTVTTDITVQGPLPAGIAAGEPIDVAITIGKIFSTLHMGRPIFAAANSEGTLFRIEPDGQHAVRVRVQYGRVTVNQIEIKSGLEPGDRVILSDMRAYDKFDRIALK